MKNRSDWKHLVGIFVVALLLRLGVVGWFELRARPLLSEEEQYLHIARTLTYDGVYQSPIWQRLLDEVEKELRQERTLVKMGDQSLFSESPSGAQRFMQRMPMYPILISATMRLSGHDNSIKVVRIIQAVIGTGSCLLVYLVASQFFDGRARLWAGWLAAVYPSWVFFTGLVLNETLFIFLLLVCWYLVTWIVVQQRKTTELPIPLTTQIAAVLMLGLFGGAAVLTKGPALGLLIVLLPVMVILARARLRALAMAVGVLLVMLTAISPWVARNYRITRLQNEDVNKSEQGGDLVLTTCSVGRSLYEAVGPEADGGPGMERIKVPIQLARKTEHDVDRYYLEEALTSIRKDPTHFLKLAVVKLFRTWNIVPNHSDYRRPLYMAVSILSIVPVVVLAIMGWWYVYSDVRGWLLLILPVVYFTVLHMVFVGGVQYRVPTMGFLMVLAGVALSHFQGRIVRESVGQDE